MSEYIGRINVSKDRMLFITNDIFNQNVKQSTTKENILKLIPDIYKNADDKEIIKMLPYRTYEYLEKLIEYIKTSNDIKEFFYHRDHPDMRYLEESMIVVMRAKHSTYNYSLNPGVIENLKRLFSDKNRKIAKRYEEIERLTVGMLYSYGVVDFNFLRQKICKYMNELISEKELIDFYSTRLNLVTFVSDYNITWTNTNETQYFVTYLDEELFDIDVVEIAAAQKSRNMQYKPFTKQEILSRDEFFYDKKAKNLYRFLKSKNANIYEMDFERLIKENELGLNILPELTDLCTFENEFDYNKFADLFMDWYNNSPQYVLGGYSPKEFRSYIRFNT